jgi:ribonuclease PH
MYVRPFIAKYPCNYIFIEYSISQKCSVEVWFKLSLFHQKILRIKFLLLIIYLMRKDGRNLNDMQEICNYNIFLTLKIIVIQKGVKNNCTSSIYLETSHLKFLAYINGPFYHTFTKTKSEDANKMNLKVNVNFPSYAKDEFNSYFSDSSKNSLELQLEQIFYSNILVDKYARAKLTINIDIFETKCDILSFAIMAITLALAEANIEQKGIISCARVIIKGEDIIADPTFEEERESEFKLTFGSLIDLQENNLFLQTGYIANQILLKKAIGTSIKMCESYQNYLISKMS